MNRLRMITMCLLAMMAASLSAKAQEVTITLFPGWNWISYPKAETQDISTALVDFEPVNGDMLKSQFGNAVYSNGYWRGSVTHFIPGWGYKYYSNRTEVVSFVFGEEAPQLTVTTAEPTEITAISAISGGSLTSSDGSYIVVLEKGICWATHPNPTVMNDFHTENGGGINSFTAEMTDLELNTMYYVRAYAVTESGTTYGEEMSFTTRDGILTLTTDSITSITALSATSGGNITDDGGLNVTARGVCWSTNPNPTVSDSHTTNGTGTGNFSSSITGLEISTTYYVRTYATTNAGTAYGNEVNFTTRDGIPTLTTDSITNITGESATSGGNITDDGGLNITARGVCWSTSPNPTVSDNHTTDSTGTGNFSSSITGLEIITTYYVRAYATTNAGTAYGNEVSFTTEAFPTGAIDGKFTINANGDQVYFSQGNLQYIGSASMPYWKFAENQWDYLGTTTGQNSANQNVNRDLFGWGTSGYNHGANCYQPWSTSQSNSDYYAYGSSQYNLYDQTGQADWGYNPISNGGNQANQWRTLTQPEWAYVFNTRTTSSGIRYAKANVNNVNGVILLPDDWSSDTYSLSNTNSTGASFSSNTISASQWNTLEQAGAVFLPAAGARVGTSVDSVGSKGQYWSASYSNSGSAWYVNFSGTNLSTGGYNRGVGRSVRLVQDNNR